MCPSAGSSKVDFFDRFVWNEFVFGLDFSSAIMVSVNASVEMGDSIKFFYKIFELFKENDDSKSNDCLKVRRRKPLREKKIVKVKQTFS